MTNVLNNELQDIAEMVLTTFGIKLPETHYKDVIQFIENRLSVSDQTISDYISSLSFDREEYIKFVDTVTINESYFFRDQRHFSLLYNEILPELFQHHDHLKIWSAATAGGEEALSIAVMCDTLLKTFPGKEYRIYASDINVTALQKLITGRYRKSSLREDGSKFHHLLSPYTTDDGDGFLVHEDIRKRITISEHNLNTEDYSVFPDGFHLVMLRNVFIYMPIENRNKVVQKMNEKIKDSGILLLSAGEIPLIWHPFMRVEERESIYFLRKHSIGDGASANELRVRKIQDETSCAATTTDKKTKDRRGRPRKKFSKEELYRSINYHLFEPQLIPDQIPEHKLAETFVHLIYSINSGRIQDSVEVLTELKKELPNNEVVLYYYGTIENMKKRPEKSVYYFRRALDASQRFWPARYELAMIMKEQSPLKAKKQFSLCRKNIRLYIDNGDYTYHFLLDGFNALYFLRICDFWEKRLNSDTE